METAGSNGISLGFKPQEKSDIEFCSIRIKRIRPLDEFIANIFILDMGDCMKALEEFTDAFWFI